MIEGSPEPTEMTGTVIAEGTGEPVEEAGLVVVSFSLVGWDNTPGGDSWSNGSLETVPLGRGTAFDTLIGAPVGSRVVILIPAANGQPSIAAVVEVLDFIPAT